jgi:hypothetical protein
VQQEEEGVPLRISGRLATVRAESSAAGSPGLLHDVGPSSPPSASPSPTPPTSIVQEHLAELPDIQLELADLTANGNTFEDTLADLIGEADDSFIDSQESLNEDTYFGRESSCEEFSEDSDDDDEYANQTEGGLEELVHAWPPELLLHPFGSRRKRKRLGRANAINAQATTTARQERSLEKAIGAMPST